MDDKSSICPVCGAEFVPVIGSKFGSRFCSMKCYQKDWYARKVADVRKVCPICGKEFHPCADHRTYCSPECMKEGKRRINRANKKSHQATGVVYERVCDFCGKPFTTNKPKQRFCCKQCQKTADNEMRNAKRSAARVFIKKTCAWCGEEFETTRNDKCCCSSKCSYNYNNHHRCSKAELDERRQAKREEAVRRAAEKKLKVRVNGLTEKQMQDVIDAHDGDPTQLYRLSQSWTPAQHKFAKSRYESKHGLWSQTFRG